MNIVKYVIGLSVIAVSNIYAAEGVTAKEVPATEIKQQAKILVQAPAISNKSQVAVTPVKEISAKAQKPTVDITDTSAAVAVQKTTEIKTVPIVKKETVTKPKVSLQTSETVTNNKTPAPKPVTEKVPAKEPIKLPPTVTTTSPGYYESSSSEWKTSIADDYSTMHELLGNKIHIGLRVMNFSLDDTDRSAPDQGNYLGTIDKLHEEQDSSLPVDFTFGFYPVRNFGIEYRYDKITAKTSTATEDNHSDGDFVTEGPIFIAVARLPLDQVVTLFNKMSGNDSIDHDTTAYNIASRFIPYAGIGYAALSGDFEESTWWGHGFASPESWEELGSPTEGNRNGYSRELRVKNENVSPYYLLGISIRIINTLYVDFSYSQESVDLDTDFYLGGRYQYTKTIPMDYTSTSIGIRYYF